MVAFKAHVGDLVCDASVDANQHGFAVVNHTLIELADAGQVSSHKAVVRRGQLDLAARHVATRLWVAQVAADDLVARHDDVCALSRPTHIPTVAQSF